MKNRYLLCGCFVVVAALLGGCSTEGQNPPRDQNLNSKDSRYNKDPVDQHGEDDPDRNFGNGGNGGSGSGSN